MAPKIAPFPTLAHGLNTRQFFIKLAFLDVKGRPCRPAYIFEIKVTDKTPVTVTLLRDVEQEVVKVSIVLIA